MPDQPTLSEALRATSAMLKETRKMIGEAGHMYDMLEIDWLINVAEVEAERRAVAAEMAAKRRNSPT